MSGVDDDMALNSEMAFELYFDLKEAGKVPPRNIIANGRRTDNRILKSDLIEIALEKMDLSHFRKPSGGLNRRALARLIQASLLERNKQLKIDDSRMLTGLGLRTIENVIKRWEKSENSSI